MGPVAAGDRSCQAHANGLGLAGRRAGATTTQAQRRSWRLPRHAPVAAKTTARRLLAAIGGRRADLIERSLTRSLVDADWARTGDQLAPGQASRGESDEFFFTIATESWTPRAPRAPWEWGFAQARVALEGFVRRAPRRLRYTLLETFDGELGRDAEGRLLLTLEYGKPQKRRELGADLINVDWACRGVAVAGPAKRCSLSGRSGVWSGSPAIHQPAS